MKDHLIPFVLGFLGCGLAFLALDYAVMHMMGLTLIFNP